ncbi:TadE/TadG family type IV pilus assembly protein [Ornithinimicrobium cryptoxanthini]|uniref:TadE/TadG family type IV pilus assembly protein n=1 Tax=Ornithinimicrobium cryptoxanthini TaxID=2934161 RepID=UPI0021192F8A|nr:TadE/TadG family type IV pilus assembly protein [Ornithinimicrobium cryptoxanthini]
MKRNGGRDRGAAAVEFALIAMMLITMLFLIVEGGRLFMIQAGASTAARDAARTMAISNNPVYAETDANKVFSPFGVLKLNDDLLITGCDDDPTTNDSARATIAWKAGLVTGMFGAELPINAKGEMRCGG